MKLLTVIGARPQFIKAATVSRLAAQQSDIEEVLVHTGQHFDDNMSAVFFRELEIAPPAYQLGIAGGTHGAMTGRMITRLEEVLLKERPDYVLVYGDTNSTLAGALAAAKLNVPIAHVEAGLRSFNRRMPEEINRVLADHASTILFTPTATATANLCREGIARDRIFQVGDVMYDAAVYYGDKAEQRSTILEHHQLRRGKYVLATVHRQENTEDPNRLRSILDALREVSRNISVVLPLHPRTKKVLSAAGFEPMLEQLLVLPPVGYLDMIRLEKNAALIATDSGGVQKEAFFYRIPCVTLRDETEWVELVDLGWNYIARPGVDDIAKIIDMAFSLSGTKGTPYGDGSAAKSILTTLKRA